MNPQITKYIEEAPAEQRKLMHAIRDIIHREVPAVIESFKWSRPVFSTDRNFAYFKSTKGYLSFGFFNFEKIKDHVHLLEGTGKDMRHIKLRTFDDLQGGIIQDWIRDMVG